MLVAGVAVPVFLLFRWSGGWSLPSRALRFIAQRSLAFYGLHALVMHLIDMRGWRRFDHPLIDIPVTWLAVTSISLALASLLRLIDRRRLVT